MIEANALHRRFGRNVALAGVDLDVARGEIFGVVGADSAGKTTLLQIMAGILDPTSGSCRVLGFDSVRDASAIAARVGYMSQKFTLYDRLSVDENLTFAARVHGVRDDVLAGRRERFLAMAGLLRFGDRRGDQLSGGMRKKLALCTNLIHEPPLLLLDEPSLGVDPLSRRELWQMLHRFRDEGATIVVATSYMDEASRCDRLALLDRGRVLALGRPADLKSRAAGQVFELAIPDAQADEAEAAILARGHVKGVQRLPGRIRFQAAIGASQQGELTVGRFGAVGAAKPRLEDIFVLASGRELASAGGMLGAPAAAPSGAGDTTIRARHVTCRFGRFVAVDDVSLDMAPGEVFGFLGPNGAGKTTLIRILCGLLQPDTGDVRVAGIDVRRRPRDVRRRIGYMSQHFSLYPDLTVRENLAFFSGAYGLSGTARHTAIAAVVAAIGLGDVLDQAAGEISGAIRQRLALACSLLHRPSALFLDEPTSGVDPGSRYRFWRLVHRLAATGAAVLVTTHYLEEAAYCHRLGLMNRGRLIACGPLERLRADAGLDSAQSVEEVFMAYIARVNAAGSAPSRGAAP